MCISYYGNLCYYWHCPGQLRPFHNAHFLSRGWESHSSQRQINILQALSIRFQYLSIDFPGNLTLHNGVAIIPSLWEDPGPWTTCPALAVGKRPPLAGVSLASIPFCTCCPVALHLNSEPHLFGCVESPLPGLFDQVIGPCCHTFLVFGMWQNQITACLLVSMHLFSSHPKLFNL